MGVKCWSVFMGEFLYWKLLQRRIVSENATRFWFRKTPRCHLKSNSLRQYGGISGGKGGTVELRSTCDVLSCLVFWAGSKLPSQTKGKVAICLLLTDTYLVSALGPSPVVRRGVWPCLKVTVLITYKWPQYKLRWKDCHQSRPDCLPEPLSFIELYSGNEHYNVHVYWGLCTSSGSPLDCPPLSCDRSFRHLNTPSYSYHRAVLLVVFY